MANTNRKPELTLNPDVDEEFEKVKAEAEATEARLNSKDAEIARLRRELAEANKRAAYEDPATERQHVRDMAEETAMNGEDPWKKTVKVRIPRRPPSEDPWYWINVNGRSVQIPAEGKSQELLLPWALVLVDMLDAEDRAREFADSIKAYDPITNPKTV